jgi:hypothetical protein
MRTTTSSLNLRSTGRRLVGALSAGAAVAVVGVTAVPVGTAMAAGIHRGPLHLAEVWARGPAALPDPGALLDPASTPGAGTVSYLHDGTGFVRV